MRDGVELATDVYLPARGEQVMTGRFPALVERTPYNRCREVLERTGRWFAERGYAVVMQDVRGRYGSGGRWSFLPSGEGPDGFDTLEWITAQPWSDGQIGLMGLSYSATNQQPLALLRPPGLRTQVCCDGGYNYHHRTLRHGGALELGVVLPYVMRMARESQELAQDEVRLEAFEKASGEMETWFRRLPLRFGKTALRCMSDYQRWFTELLTSSDYGDYWKHSGWNLEEHIDRYPDLPSLLQTSWYGHHIWATTEKWSKLRQQGSAPKQLLIGHWTHGYADYERAWCGEVDFGPEAAIDLNATKLRWFDQILRGIDTGLGEEPPVRIFVMGGGTGRRNGDGRVEHGGTWRNECEWPLARTRWTRYFLHPSGELRLDAPGPEMVPSCYRYDPLDPVPTVGGGTQNTDSPYLPQGGAFDQVCRKDLAACTNTLPLADRPDVLVFRSDPLDAAVEVTGPIIVKLWVASSAKDTDFTAKLIDQYPPRDGADGADGFAMNLTDGLLRMRYRASRERSELMVPGEIYAIEFELQATSNLFAARHRIRVDISSSNFPRFDPNPNTGDLLGLSGPPRVAENSIFHDKLRASHIVLPIIPK
jgi:putative CocE/NonD family hydrolase